MQTAIRRYGQELVQVLCDIARIDVGLAQTIIDAVDAEARPGFAAVDSVLDSVEPFEFAREQLLPLMHGLMDKARARGAAAACAVMCISGYAACACRCAFACAGVCAPACCQAMLPSIVFHLDDRKLMALANSLEASACAFPEWALHWTYAYPNAQAALEMAEHEHRDKTGWCVGGRHSRISGRVRNCVRK